MRWIYQAGLLTVLGSAVGGCSEKAPSRTAIRPPSVSPPHQQPNSTHSIIPTDLQQLLQKNNLTNVRCIPLLKRSGRSIYGIEIARAIAVQTRDRIAADAIAAGYYPLIVSEIQKLTQEKASAATSVSECLQQADTIDVQQLFQRKYAECTDESTPKPDFNDDDPSVNERDEFALLPEDDATWHLVFIPTTKPWEVFAYLNYGGWNEYPQPEQHVAVMKYWFERYGAEPVIVTGDIIEMRVARPPTSITVCRDLALEQFSYTGGDLVFQGYEHFGTLARCLMNRTHWFFWWD